LIQTTFNEVTVAVAEHQFNWEKTYSGRYITQVYTIHHTHIHTQQQQQVCDCITCHVSYTPSEHLLTTHTHTHALIYTEIIYLQEISVSATW